MEAFARDANRASAPRRRSVGTGRFFVIPGHQDRDIEDVVEANAGTFNVVRPHAGPAREIATATDPRTAGRSDGP